MHIRGVGSNARPYFKVLPERGPGIVTAERRVSLEGAVNFRDLGGYGTSNGHTVKWGQVFRSDSLGRLTTRDQAILVKTGIRVVYGSVAHYLKIRSGIDDQRLTLLRQELLE